MSDLVDRLRDFNKSEAVRIEAADRIEQLERVLAQALATLKDGDMDMVHATIAAIDEALNARVHQPPQAVGCNGGVDRLVNEGTEGNEQWTR